MKKKNLIILLIIPFIISLLGIVTINVSINTFYGDITGIEWEYDDVEAFQLNGSKYSLKATPLNASNAPLDSGNGLIWMCENKDVTIEEPIANITFEKGEYYLVPNTEGEIVITCSNLKGNIFKKMTAIIYTDGVIIITPEISGSQNNIDDDIYYGQYDLVNNEKKQATFNFNVKCIPTEITDSLTISSHTDNIAVNLKNKQVTIKNSGDASFTLSAAGNKQVYEFNVVKNGINVYTYDDLMYCTNKSEAGEIVCLRKSFETQQNKDSTSANNVELFGNVGKDNKFDFSNDVYLFDTTYNDTYIKQWNEFVKNNSNYNEISNKVVAGLRVQKDFYGNGYTINMHNLTYPTSVIIADGTNLEIPVNGPDDLFKGPKQFYTLGDPLGLPLATAFGQDNVGMYIDGNNITVNDVNVKNCELKGSLSFLSTVGTVMDINGDNNTVINSRLSNGKNVLRTFSTENFTLKNSLLSNSMNFLMEVGTNEYMPYNETKKYDFSTFDGKTSNSTIGEYLGGKDSLGDLDLNAYIMGEYIDSNAMKNSMTKLQNALNNHSSINESYKATITIDDTYFYKSGISAIAMETMFNGPFLYSPLPSIVTEIFGMMSMEGKPVIPLTPTKVGGTSYPAKVDIVGNTRFYDYKDASNIDITGLVNENISVIASEVFGKDREINIDTVFPIKPILLSEARKQKSTYISEEKEYINIPIAYYGGGLNLSVVNLDLYDEKDKFNNPIAINFLDNYLSSSSMTGLMSVMLKCVTIVSGFEPFKFVCVKGDGYLYGETPKVSDLIANAKGV